MGKDDAKDEVLKFVKRMNRPYSVIQLVDNLHGKIKKSVMQTILDELVEEGQVSAKEYGKAKIYTAE